MKNPAENRRHGVKTTPNQTKHRQHKCPGTAHKPEQTDSDRYRNGFGVFRPRSKTCKLRDSPAECTRAKGPLRHGRDGWPLFSLRRTSRMQTSYLRLASDALRASNSTQAIRNLRRLAAISEAGARRRARESLAVRVGGTRATLVAAAHIPRSGASHVGSNRADALSITVVA